MTRIDPAVILGALGRVAQESSKSSIASSAGPADRHLSTSTASAASSQQQMLLRIKAIPADDPQRRDKAFRFFMEFVLLEKFGSTLQTDPSFPQLIDRVLAHMEEDPELQQACISAADALLSQVE